MNDSQSTTTKYKTNKDLEKKKYEKKFVFITDVKNTHDTTDTRARSTSPNSHEIIFFFYKIFFIWRLIIILLKWILIFV
jgi:hypothetical protein